MLRQVQGANVPYPGATKVAPVSKGGTSASEEIKAVDNIGGIHKSKLGVAGGVLKADGQGHLPASIIGDQTAFGYSIDGPLSLVHGQTADYFVTNFSSHRRLIASVSAGGVSVIADDTIRIQAPNSGTELILTIGPRSISIPLSPIGPARPGLQTVTGDQKTSDRVFYTTEFRAEPMLFSAWTTAPAGTSAVVIPAGTYAVEILGRKGNAGVAKLTMNGIDYSCGVAKTNRRIVVSAGAPVSVSVSGTGVLQYRFVTTSMTHLSTDWEIATDPSFATIVKSSYNDTVNKLSWAVSLPDGNYYLRFRHKGSSD